MAKRPKFVLPGTWGRVNLDSEAASRRSIRKLAESATGRKEELASVRNELRDRLQTAADAAREGGASDFYIAFELAKGIPLPAWLAVFEPEIESTDFAALGLDELTKLLEAGASVVGTGENAEVVASQPSTKMHAVRHSWRRTAHVAEGDVEKDFELIEADYWLAATDPNRIALLTFSTAYAEYEEEMLSLFDAVVSTIRWPATPVAAS